MGIYEDPSSSSGEKYNEHRSSYAEWELIRPLPTREYQDRSLIDFAPQNGESPFQRLFEDAYDIPDKSGIKSGEPVQPQKKPIEQVQALPERPKTKPAEDERTKYFALLGASNDGFLKDAESVFKKIDTDNNGYLSEKEVAAAVTNPDIKDREAVIVALLKQKLPTIQTLGKDGDTKSGASLTDLRALFANLKRYDQESEEAIKVYLYGQKMFNDIDANKDGSLSQAEVNAYRVPLDAPERAEKVAALESIKRLYHDIKNAHNDEWFGETKITMLDLNDYGAMVIGRHQFKFLGSVKDSMAGARLNLYRKRSDDLYGNKEHPLESIRPDAVEQGSIGDCFYLGALASPASTDVGKKMIRDMIKDNGVDAHGKRTYTVTFPGAPDEPITVDQPTDSEIGLYAGVTEHGTWVAVLEKAYAKYVNSSMYRRATMSAYAVDQDALDSGSSAMSGLKILTKSGAATRLDTSDQEGAKREIQAALSEGRPITLSAKNELKYLFGFGENKTPSKLSRGHTYSVIGFDPNTNMVKIRNPWGIGEPKDDKGAAKDGINDGIFQMSLADLAKDFDVLEYGRK